MAFGSFDSAHLREAFVRMRRLCQPTENCNVSSDILFQIVDGYGDVTLENGLNPLPERSQSRLRAITKVDEFKCGVNGKLVTKMEIMYCIECKSFKSINRIQ